MYKEILYISTLQNVGFAYWVQLYDLPIANSTNVSDLVCYFGMGT